MNRKSLLVIWLLTMFQVGCLAHPPVATVTVHAINQDGKPVTDTEIVGTFENGKIDVTKWPDENGYVTFSSPVMGTALFFNKRYRNIRNPDGFDKYYDGTVTRDYMNPAKYAVNGKWTQWSEPVTLVLKEYINPIPMYVNGRGESFRIPARNEWCGFDMEVYDWTAPYGKGVHADLEVFHKWDGKDRTEYTGSHLTIRFPDKEAGCYPFYYEHREKYDAWRLKSPYHADIHAAYTSSLEFYEKKHPGAKRLDSHLFPNGTGYIFRTRTRFDEKGKLVGARYGKIYQPHSSLLYFWVDGARIRIPYYLNPTENDTNLEYDMQHNLIKQIHPSRDP